MFFHIGHTHIQQSSHFGRNYITGNQFDFARFDFSDSSPYFGKLCFDNVGRDIFWHADNQSNA